MGRECLWGRRNIPPRDRGPKRGGVSAGRRPGAGPEPLIRLTQEYEDVTIPQQCQWVAPHCTPVVPQPR